MVPVIIDRCCPYLHVVFQSAIADKPPRLELYKNNTHWLDPFQCIQSAFTVYPHSIGMLSVCMMYYGHSVFTLMIE